jgi:hypothetical protein
VHTAGQFQRRGQEPLGNTGQYGVITPIFSLSMKSWKRRRRFKERSKLRHKAFPEIYWKTCKTSRTTRIEDQESLLGNYPTLGKAVGTKSGNFMKLHFQLEQRKSKGESEILRICKKVFGRTGLIGWGAGHWRKGQASGVLLKILLKDPNLRSRIIMVQELNTSCKCSNCLGLPKMVHPVHHGQQVYGLYQCTNKGCNMTWHRDVGGEGGIFRRLHCSVFDYPLPETYQVFGESVLGKRSRRELKERIDSPLQNQR